MAIRCVRLSVLTLRMEGRGMDLLIGPADDFDSRTYYGAKLDFGH